MPDQLDTAALQAEVNHLKALATGPSDDNIAQQYIASLQGKAREMFPADRFHSGYMTCSSVAVLNTYIRESSRTHS